MNIETASKLIEENLHMVYTWSLSKLYDRSEAEDLAQDIICAALRSVERLENDKAFWGFFWRLAQNQLKLKLRKKNPEFLEWDEGIYGGAYGNTFSGSMFGNSPEDDVVRSEELRLLRRELSLLSYQYREVTVRYYMLGKSCSEISTELKISMEMVKYYLFKTRKILKEGIGMTREYGEKSYNPGVFHMDYWGTGPNQVYWDLFKRRLPGNVLLSAYDKPVSITELSIELGVSAVYLEDEIKILKKHDFIKEIGDKYQTNIIIFTEEYEKRVEEKLRPIFQRAAREISEKLDELFPALSKYEFSGKSSDTNHLKWIFANLVMWHAWKISNAAGNKKFGNYPQLSNGSFGFVYGFDSDVTNSHFRGIYNLDENQVADMWISITNYTVIEKCQFWKPDRDWNAAMVSLAEVAKQGIANFPVFASEVFWQIKETMFPIIDIAAKSMMEMCEVAGETLKDYVPRALTSHCGQLAHIHHQNDAMAFLIETMVTDGVLIVPEEKVNLCIFGVGR